MNLFMSSSNSEVGISAIGIDVGGTKTHVMGEDGDGQFQEFTVSSASWRGNGTFPTLENMAQLALLVRSYFRVLPATRVVAGIHGCDTPVLLDVAQRGLMKHFGESVRVFNDADILGAAGGDLNVVRLVAGTGAIVVGTDSSGKSLTSDGYSWMLGDYGGASAIVREALRKILLRSDRGLIGRDPLMPSFLTAFGAEDAPSLAVAATSSAGAAGWGKHSRVVFTAAEQGSLIAQEVIDEAGRILAEGVYTVLDRGAVANAILAAGGVIVNQPLLQERVSHHLADLGIQLPFNVLKDPPVLGALRLARGDFSYA